MEAGSIARAILQRQDSAARIESLLEQIARNTARPARSFLIELTFLAGTSTLLQARPVPVPRGARGFRLQVISGITLAGVLPVFWRVRHSTESGVVLAQLTNPTIATPPVDVYPGGDGMVLDQLDFSIELTAAPVGFDVIGTGLISIL